jgi:hypothetical protein
MDLRFNLSENQVHIGVLTKSNVKLELNDLSKEQHDFSRVFHKKLIIEQII